MGQHQIFTPGKLLGFSVILFTVAQTLGQLNHSTSGHVFMLLGFAFFAWAIILWIREDRSSPPKGQESSASSQSLPSPIRPAPQIPSPIVETVTPPKVVHQPETTIKPHSGPMIFADESWHKYTRDVFYNAIWQWHYKPEFGKMPLGLTPYCSECAEPQQLQTALTPQGGTIYICWACGEEYAFPLPAERDFRFIKENVKKKLEDGTWRNVVNRQTFGQ